MPEETKPKPSVLSPATLVPIGVAIVVMVPAFGGWTWLSRQLDSIDRRLERMEKKSDGAVLESDADAWIKVLRAQNPKLSVPDLH